ncbi:two-component regulator propeller domain-containing protein [Phocaeicola plebeius]|uniref:hybrid sensor histidine kinase/response regulator transcription factor n=1 Tax=Phocaeicola plebeius TaxID=310297 RepID=UPI0026F13A11|nr:two-component regulator propeller domain-containing protein [Phocaeicola plebeius]
MKYIFIILGMLIFSVWPLSSDIVDNYNFTYYRIEDGLHDEFILSTYKDKHGYIWICSTTGLCRFDGHMFVHFSSLTDDPSIKIKASYVSQVLEDNHDHLWIVSDLGLIRMNQVDGTVNYYNDYDKDPLSLLSQPMKAIQKDRYGNLWIGLQNQLAYLMLDSNGDIQNIYSIGVEDNLSAICIQDDLVWIGGMKGVQCYRYVGNQLVKEPMIKELEQLSLEKVNTLFVNGHYLWIGTLNGLFCYNGMGKTIQHFTCKKGQLNSLSDNNVTCLAMDPSGNMLIGTSAGIDFYSRNGQFEHVCQKGSKHGLNSQFTTHIQVDDKGYIWIGTLIGGLNLMTPKRIRFEHFLAAGGDDRNVVSALFQDRDGNVFAGVMGKGLVIKYADETKPIVVSSISASAQSLSEEHVFKICQDSRGDYWLATRVRGLCYMRRDDLYAPVFTSYNTDNSLISSDVVYDLIMDPVRDGLWLCTENGINFMDLKTRTFQKIQTTLDETLDICYTLFLDRKNRLWVGGNGICIIDLSQQDPGSGKYVARFYRYKLDEPDSGISERICSLLETSDGDFYIGSQMHGLYVLNEEKDGEFVFRNILPHELKEKKISSIVEDMNNCLWVSTLNGLYYYNPHRGCVLHFDQLDGLPERQFFVRAGCNFTHQCVAFGTVNGFTFLYPYQMGVVASREVKITGIRSEGRLITDENLELFELFPNQIQNFEICFSALEYSSPDKVMYAYKIDELDKDWNIENRQNYVRYNNLMPGNYTFRIRCTDTDGTWSDKEAVLRIHIHSPFYQTAWFRGALFVVLLGVVGGIFYWYQKGQKQIQMRLSKEVAERTQSLTVAMDNLVASRNAISLQNELLTQRNKEILEQSEQVNRLSRQMDQANKERLMLFTSLTHEFKTPLTLIIGPITNLLATHKDSVLQEPFQMIERNARYLLALVNQIIYLRKVDARQFRFDAAPYNVSSLLDSVRDYMPILQTRGIVYEEQMRLKHDCIRSDQHVLNRIFSNLLSNAVKYTPDNGKIIVRMAQGQVNEQKHTLMQYLSVTNTGSYIGVEEQEKIFHCFYKIKDQQIYPSDGQSSSGVGLYLVYQLVTTVLNGKIIVKSSPKIGTSFRICFETEWQERVFEETVMGKKVSQEVDSEVMHVGKEVLTEGETTGKPLLLLVEDNRDMRAYIKGLLNTRYAVIEAGDGQQGYVLAQKYVPDFIISDLMMPVCDGTEFCHRIREDVALSHVPFLMLTALSSDDARLDSYRQGVDAFLTKPFEPDLLLLRIENILRNREKRQLELVYDLGKRLVTVNIEKPDKLFMEKLMQIMEEHYTNPEFSVSELAAEMRMSNSSFYKKITALTGLSASAFIRLYRLQIGKRLLEEHVGEAGISVSEIAYSVGFSDPKYFTRCFVKEYQIQPKILLMKKQEE